MTDYYKILGVRRSASRAEIKSAYRKLARLRHPDVNPGSEEAAGEFTLLSKAYHTLSDPQERAHYDQQLLSPSSSNYSILHSNNPHAQRARNIAVQARWDRVVDEVLERDRKENRERQRAVFTTVSLFLSTFVWHLATRLREYFAHYTYIPKPIQDSIMRQEEKPEQPYTRFSAYTFLLLGYGLSAGIGLLIGWHTQDFFNDLTLLFRHRVEVVQSSMLAYSYASLLVPDLVVYPPIAVLIVDTMHALASRID